MSVPGRRAFYILLLLAVFGLSGPIWASGAKEDGLPRAEELLEEMKYNEAILLITEVIRTHPEKFDEAQELLGRIRESREYYNEKYSDLIEAYQGNLEDAYPLIKELEDMDPEPNDAAAESLKLAKETAGFVYNNNRFLAIMDQAAELLEQGRYYEAVGVYTTGYDLSRDIFEDENYGNIIESLVGRLARSLQATVSDVLSGGARFDTTAEALQDAARGGEIVQAALAGFLEEASDMNDRREVLLQLAGEFLRTEADIRSQRADDKQVHYLVFLNRLLQGRAEAETPEGIIYAIERVWTEGMTAGDIALWDALQNTHRAALDAYGAAEGLETAAGILESHAEAYAVFVSAWGQGLYLDDSFAPRSFAGDIIGDKLPRYQSALVLRDISLSLRELAEAAQTMSGLTESLREAAAAGDVEGIVEALSAVDESLAGQRAFWEEEERKIGAYAEGPGDFTYPAELASEMREAAALQIDNAEDLRISAVDRKADILIQPLRRDFEAVVTELNRGKEFLDGLVEIRGEGEDSAEVVFHYPDRALEICLAADETFRELEDGLEGVTSFLRGEDPEVLQSDRIQTRAAEKDGLLEQVKEQQDRSAALASEAEEKIFLAARYRQEGEQRMEEARQLTDRNQFSAAKERLVAASERFDESLFYQEDPELRALRNDGITAMYEEINDAENALVIREVRDYIIQGKSLYSQGEFAQARNTLLRAENRWSDTNVEPNPEIDYWLSLTQTALSVTSGREINETDPLFAEMSQYLNQARADYRTGRDLTGEGKKQEADFYLNRAEKNILYVQQYFPFNKEARVLNLLISQMRDRDQFRELFRKDFTDARELISTNPQKAYIDLKDLQTIEPNYPGISQAILEAEYAAGIKVRPPDRTKIDQSAKLYEDANRIYTQGSRAQFPLALSLLDEAIRLNPDNIAAVRLKDTISVATGGQSTSVFSNEEQQVYLEAVNAFTAGNFNKASILVDILLQNPDNQRNTKLLELQERIEAVR